MKLLNPRHLYKHCPLCRSENFRLRIRCDCRAHPLYHPALPEIINWQECDDCGHSFTDGYFTEPAMRLLTGKALDKGIPKN